MALYIAADIVLTRFASLQFWNFRLGFSFVVIAIAGMRYGVTPALIVAIVSDLIGATLFPSGQFFVGFTISAALDALVYGFLFHRKLSLSRILAAAALTQFVVSLLIQTLWISILYDNPYAIVLYSRIPTTLLMAAVKIVVLLAISKSPLYALLRDPNYSEE